MLRAVRREGAELSILLCSDPVMRELNRVHRGLDKPTDVLAFPMLEGPGSHVGGPDVLGDVAISIDRARDQARRAGKTIVFEVTYLLAHGLLHLLGYDHASAAELRRMKARTDLLVAAALQKS